MEILYYVQNGFVGNCMMWWEQNNSGYVGDIRKARVFTKAELDKMYSIKDGSKKAWPKKYIDERISHHVDMQYCDVDMAKYVTK